MKKYLVIGLSCVAVFFNCCTNAQTQNTKTNLPPTEFASKIKELPNAPIVDVRASG